MRVAGAQPGGAYQIVPGRWDSALAGAAAARCGDGASPAALLSAAPLSASVVLTNCHRLPPAVCRLLPPPQLARRHRRHRHRSMQHDLTPMGRLRRRRGIWTGSSAPTARASAISSGCAKTPQRRCLLGNASERRLARAADSSFLCHQQSAVASSCCRPPRQEACYASMLDGEADLPADEAEWAGLRAQHDELLAREAFRSLVRMTHGPAHARAQSSEPDHWTSSPSLRPSLLPVFPLHSSSNAKSLFATRSFSAEFPHRRSPPSPLAQSLDRRR